MMINDQIRSAPGKTVLPDCRGYCRRCRREHRLPLGQAGHRALRLLLELQLRGTIGLFDDSSRTDGHLTTAPLFGTERGKMFGVLEGRTGRGESRWLFAFSGQYRGRWLVPGWAPPLFNPAEYRAVHDPAEARIKDLSRSLLDLGLSRTRRQQLQDRRRRLSRRLMGEIQQLYRVSNFRGDRASLDQAFLQNGGKPTGTGDCCAPKLLNLAAELDLAPVSLAEFYFGRTTSSGTRKHGWFYSPCEDKCRPLLGYLLCGAEEKCNGR